MTSMARQAKKSSSPSYRWSAFWWLLPLLVLAGCASGQARPLEVPELQGSDYYWIAARIYENETGSQSRYLTFWNENEDFPSFGIGHFIWFPAGVDAPFDESFPAMAAYVGKHASECSPMPEWMRELESFDPPWSSKEAFDDAQQSERMVSLRQWLSQTAPEQVRYIASSFAERWNALDLPPDKKDPRTEIMQRLLQDPRGVFAAIDYFNFKGLGSNPGERYKGEGWGLVQVLGDVAAMNPGEDADVVALFSEAAAERLRLRVKNAPAERKVRETGWLPGWERRTVSYAMDAPALSSAPDSAYRITPYLQRISAHEATVSWFSERATSGRMTLRSGVEDSREDERVIPTTPQKACELHYHLAEYRNLAGARDLPYKHEVHIDGLVPGREYRYVAVQDGETATGRFRTPGGEGEDVRFIVYGDIETEPESTGTRVRWPAPGGENGGRQYLVDQTDGYAANLSVIAERHPDFIAVAGDLVQSGGEQRDWDEFWRHNSRIAASIPIVPALGNHDYHGGPGDLGGYGQTGTARALAKFQRYFGNETYYVLDYGPIAMIVIDANNGVPDLSESDTNFRLVSHGDVAPPWNASPQKEWIAAALAAAQQDKAFTFVMFHVAPYSSGYHGKPPGFEPSSDVLSGTPVRELTPLFLQYGVDAVFSGHDEMYEHSAVHGTELIPDGGQQEHTVHFFDVGIAGDGLRGPVPGVENPHQIFLAHIDAPEIRDESGALIDGGKHYGHLEVNVTAQEDGGWQAHFEPVYVFPPSNERRVYDDELVLVSGGDD